MFSLKNVQLALKKLNMEVSTQKLINALVDVSSDLSVTETFPYGKYKERSLKEVMVMDKKYCERMVSHETMNELYPEFQSVLAGLFAAKTQPLDDDGVVMPAGKHKGRSLEELLEKEKNFCSWFIQQDNLKEKYPNTVAKLNVKRKRTE